MWMASTSRGSIAHEIGEIFEPFIESFIRVGTLKDFLQDDGRSADGFVAFEQRPEEC